jgi:predicted ArsR family transcriptional regulator
MGRTKRVSDEEILRAIATAPDPIVTAPELAKRVDYSVDGARERLKNLEERGFVRQRDVGARASIWWLTPEGRQQLA